jgi:excinuclease ABC subunit A
MYVLDEPSIGLHQRDNQKLIDTLKGLRDLGNTVIVVEHDEDTILQADHVIDLGPGAGRHGGNVVAQGTPQEVANSQSTTGEYLSKHKEIYVPKKRRTTSEYITITGCKENNLKDVRLEVPVGIFSCVTGVSGSGKSTLVTTTLQRALRKHLMKTKETPGKYETLDVPESVEKVVEIDQSPIGRTPRSNPATYTKVFDDIRKLYADTKESRMRGYDQGRFSFNVKGGRCETCKGDGTIKIEMNFLPDVYVECEQCEGARYNEETLEIQYKGKNIADILNMTIEEALEFFKKHPNIKRKLKTLVDVGLDYLKLGQPSTTLSGGEAQRIKLTRELAKRTHGKTIYILDEPTTGLHFEDIRKLLRVLQRLVEKGNTILVIEHNLDVIKTADFIIDLGLEGGEGGGEIVAAGTPEEVAEMNTHTAKFLKTTLKGASKKEMRDLLHEEI